MTDRILWKNPYDGREYEVGETIPVYQTGDGGLVHNSTVVRLEDPGFPGVVEVKGGGLTEFHHGMGIAQVKKWVIPALEPDTNWFYLGPSEQGWRMYYARKELAKSRAMEIASFNALLGDDDEDDN